MGPCHHPLQIPLGLAVWLLWFGAAYGGLSLGCALAPPAVGQGPWNWLNAALGVSAAAVALLLFWLAGRCWQAARRAEAGAGAGASRESGERFVARVSAAVHFISALATLFMAYPLARLAPCV